MNAATGVSATINFTGIDNSLTAMQALYSGVVDGNPFMVQLKSLALQGDTPIQHLTIVGHSGGRQGFGLLETLKSVL